MDEDARFQSLLGSRRGVGAGNGLYGHPSTALGYIDALYRAARAGAPERLLCAAMDHEEQQRHGRRLREEVREALRERTIDACLAIALAHTAALPGELTAALGLPGLDGAERALLEKLLGDWLSETMFNKADCVRPRERSAVKELGARLCAEALSYLLAKRTDRDPASIFAKALCAADRRDLHSAFGTFEAGMRWAEKVPEYPWTQAWLDTLVKPFDKELDCIAPGCLGDVERRRRMLYVRFKEINAEGLW